MEGGALNVVAGNVIHDAASAQTQATVQGENSTAMSHAF